MIKHQPIRFTVKRNNNHICIKTDFLKLLDISNYVAPGFSYGQFLKAYECEQTKGFFPYEWIDSLDKLKETSLPPHKAFYSSLKNTNITDQEYTYCQQVWQENNMITFKEFLVWYNNLDVVPFLEAVEKMSQFWQERKIDMFKDGISVPGLTLKYMFSFLDKQTYFSLFDRASSDLYHLIKDHNTGGPTRRMMQGKTAWWCPSKCLLPWTADEKKPALYAELSVQVLEEYQNPNPVPHCEIHNKPCKLEVVNKDKCKEECLANKLFLTCARKNDNGHCSFVKSAEIHGQKGQAFALMFKNHKNKNFQNSCSMMPCTHSPLRLWKMFHSHHCFKHLQAERA
ncbi:hypothetical protein ACROYT_G015598 [Oculina patagonica]